MAKLKPIRIDDQIVTVKERTPLKDIVPAEVHSVRTDQGALITRDQFARVPIPEGFQTNLSAINKGGRLSWTGAPWSSSPRASGAPAAK